MQIPGRDSSNGKDSDAMEGFTRLSLLRVFLHRAAQDSAAQDSATSTKSPLDLNRFAEAINLGTNPGTAPGTAHHTAWPTIPDNQQSIVEAASLATSIRLLGPDFYNNLPQQTIDQFTQWVTPALTAKLPDNNWHMFRYVIAATLETLNGPTRDTTNTLQQVPEIINAWHLGRGWYSDGPGRRIDYYSSWAFHFYPEIEHLLNPDRQLVPDLHQRSTQFSEDLLHLIGPGGAPIAWGRSLIYRYGVATAFSTNLLIAPASPHQLEFAASATAVLDFFARHGQLPGHPTKMGWTHPRQRITQPYSGPASALWAAKVFARLLIPADHPSWNEPNYSPQPVPKILEAPGFLIVAGSSHPQERVLINHGTAWPQAAGSANLCWNLYDQTEFSTHKLPPHRGWVLRPGIIHRKGLKFSISVVAGPPNISDDNIVANRRLLFGWGTMWLQRALGLLGVKRG